MERLQTTLALAIGIATLTGCASTQAGDARTQEEKLADFQRNVRDYKRLQAEQAGEELASEGDKRSEEARGDASQPQPKVVLPD